jgi:sugar phosphate isomerase/epimerase
MVVAFSRPDAMDVSPLFRLQADLGQLVDGNIDPVAYIRDHHAHITSVYLTDCRKGAEEKVVWGHGDAPIREVLQLLEREGWPIHAYVKCQPGAGSVIEEVKRCVAYAKHALA